MTKTHSVAALVTRILADILDRPASELAPEQQLLQDLDMDSLALYEFVIELEEHYKIQISDEDIDRIHTIQDVIREIEQRQSAGKD